MTWPSGVGCRRKANTLCFSPFEAPLEKVIRLSLASKEVEPWTMVRMSCLGASRVRVRIFWEEAGMKIKAYCPSSAGGTKSRKPYKEEKSSQLTEIYLATNFDLDLLIPGT